MPYGNGAFSMTVILPSSGKTTGDVLDYLTNDYIFTAPSTKKYTFQTVGQLNTVMVVSEIAGTENYYMSGDYDSGFDKKLKNYPTTTT